MHAVFARAFDFIASIDVRLPKQSSVQSSLNNKESQQFLRRVYPGVSLGSSSRVLCLCAFPCGVPLVLTTSTFQSYYDELSNASTPPPTEAIMDRYLRAYDDPLSVFNLRYTDPSRRYHFVVISCYRRSRLLWVWVLSDSDAVELDIRLNLLDTP
jgi:hypothetical protein